MHSASIQVIQLDLEGTNRRTSVLVTGNINHHGMQLLAFTKAWLHSLEQSLKTPAPRATEALRMQAAELVTGIHQ
jgi:hypothetical protein